ncbi:MAG: rubredoxin [Limnochordia bacterium]
MSAEQWEKVERSRFTNGLHIELLSILPTLQEIARQGIEDALDPRCVSLFEHLLEQANFIEQSAKAELEGHMKYGKWG